MRSRKNKKLILKRAFIYTFLLTLMVLFAGFAVRTSAYNCRSGDTACQEAKNNMNQNRAEANVNTREANSVAERIRQIDANIAALNSKIAANEARINELNAEIEKNEKKLADHQTALAELLIDMHFGSGTEPISLLAGSNSISDYAEKQAREDTANEEIVAASKKIKELKEDLVKKKDEAEQAKQENEAAKREADSDRAEKNALKAEYDKKADDASALAAYWEEKLKLLAWTPPSNTSGNGSRWWGVGNTYPYQNNCPRDNVRYSAYGGAVCQCTSYASWKAKEKWGITNTWGGNAYNYVNAKGYYVPATGINTYVDRNPAPYTIAVQTGGQYGHVMWVESVNENGSVNITEYNVNWSSIGCNIGDFCSRKNVGSAGMWFVHFE
jgi:surface antigen